MEEKFLDLQDTVYFPAYNGIHEYGAIGITKKSLGIILNSETISKLDKEVLKNSFRHTFESIMDDIFRNYEYKSGKDGLIAHFGEEKYKDFLQYSDHVFSSDFFIPDFKILQEIVKDARKIKIDLFLNR